MSDSIVVMASDGLLEFEEGDIEDVSIDEVGTHVLLKTGHAFLLVGHEAKELIERMAEKIRNLVR